jgi:hypothetical protein
MPMTGGSKRDFSFPQPGTRSSERQGETGVLGTVKNKAEELVSNVTETAENAWSSTREEAQAVASQVAGTAEQAWDNLTGFIRRYPVACLCAAVGVGFLLAETMERMRSNR